MGSDDTDDGDDSAPEEEGSDALRNFLDGLADKINSAAEITVSSPEEKREAMEEIARDLGLEDEYLQGGEEDQFFARSKVRIRYEELLDGDVIQEAPEVAEQTEQRVRWKETLNAHLNGEETIYSGVDNTI
jgi:hypothetical protein